MKPLIITITGLSGAGKDTVAEYLCDHTDWNRIVSFTTRPIREGEVNGREHYFVSEDRLPTAPGSMLCHTIYPPSGGYHYWVIPEQFDIYPVNVYVVDEVGLKQLELVSDKYYIHKVLITRDEQLRRSSGVSDSRIERDDHRTALPDSYYDTIIKNNKSISALHHRLHAFIGHFASLNF